MSPPRPSMARLWSSLALFMMAAFLLQPSARSETRERKVAVVAVDDDITLGLSAYVRRALGGLAGFDAVILTIDTYGGRVDAAIEIASAIEHAGIPVHAWVEDKAWSAGALISLACRSISMRKSASIGSAMPVSGGSTRTTALGEKYVSALRAKFRALAEKNGYPPAIAAAMVDRDIEISLINIGGEDRYVPLEEAKSLQRQSIKKTKIETVSAKGKLLNLTAKRAIHYGIARDAETLADVLKEIGLEGAKIVPIPKTGSERFINIITSTAAASVLVFLGFMLISGEMHAPGFGALGLSGLGCFILVYWGHHLADLAGILDLLLILGGVLLIGLEIFVVPGFGVTGMVGFASLMIGLYLMLVPFVIPETPWDFARLKEVIWVLLAAGAGCVMGMISMILMIPRLPMFKRYGVVRNTGAAPADAPPPGELGRGSLGLSLSLLGPKGRAQFGTRFIDVRAASGNIASGVQIEILEPGKIPTVRPVDR